MLKMILYIIFLSELVFLKAGDDAVREMKYEEALRFYLSALEHTRQPAEIYWRLSRLYILIGDMKTDTSCLPDYRQAEKYARACLSACPQNADGHAWLAASLGCRAVAEDTKTRVRLARDIHAACLTAIKLNPSHDVAYSILGSFYHALGKITYIERQLAHLFLGGIPSGGFEEAEKAFQSAISFSPTTFRHHYELGWLYYDWGKPKQAHQCWTHALTLPSQMPFDKERKKTIRKMLSLLTSTQ